MDPNSGRTLDEAVERRAARKTQERDMSPPRLVNIESGGVQSIATLQKEVVKLRSERDSALQQSVDWQTRASALKAELDKERGSVQRVMVAQGGDRERELRRDLQAEISKSEAAWKERIRNERLLRLSYERVLLNLGFSPNRIASDLVRVSRPFPLTENPDEYKTTNLLQLDEALVSQSQSKRRGLFSYDLDQIKSGFGANEKRIEGNAPSVQEGPPRYSGGGRRELLRSLALESVPR